MYDVLKVFFANATRLFTQLKMAKTDGSAIKEMTRVEKQDLLILGDFGIQSLDEQGRMMLRELVEDRHGKRSTLFTSQLPVQLCYEINGDQTLADEILDGGVNDTHLIDK